MTEQKKKKNKTSRLATVENIIKLTIEYCAYSVH